MASVICFVGGVLSQFATDLPAACLKGAQQRKSFPSFNDLVSQQDDSFRY